MNTYEQPRNFDHEKKTELSPHLLKLLEVVFREYPELRNTQVVTFPPEDDFDAGGLYRFVAGKQGEPIAQICISEGDSQLLAPLFAIRQSSIKVNAEMLGIHLAQLTPKLLQMFIIAHELGHLREYKNDYEADSGLPGWMAVEEMDYHRQSVLSMLPIANVEPTHLARELKDMIDLKDVVNRFPELSKYHGFKQLVTVSDVLSAQEIEYRSSVSEAYADKFAVAFLTAHAAELGISDVFAAAGTN